MKLDASSIFFVYNTSDPSPPAAVFTERTEAEEELTIQKKRQKQLQEKYPHLNRETLAIGTLECFFYDTRDYIRSEIRSRI
jgi:hypothetical protein